MKDKRCGCFSNASECPENDCEGCPARLKSEVEIRAEAIEEFAEAVKAEIFPMLRTEEEYAVAEKALDDIAKEMKGE
jgi:DNA-binding transcriptional regulator of glucitol operon